MAQQLFIQTVPRHASWLLVGPPGATSLMPQQDITVTFTDSSSVVVPAGTPAALPGGGTTWDRTVEVVVGYVVKGSGTLLAALESQLAGLATDYAPLVRVLADSVQVYQPQQPSGAAIKAGAWSGGAALGSARSWSGGAFYGAFDSQSWSGGASVSGVSFRPAYGNNETKLGMYVLCTAYPSSTTTLYDMDAGGNGYERTAITSAGHILAEFANAGVSYSVDLGVMPLNQWCWIATASAINIADNNALLVHAVLYNGAGTLIGSDYTNHVNMATNRPTSFTAVLSVGLPGSGSYAAAPNNGTMKFSKLRHHNVAGDFVWGPLSSDTSGDLNDYMARQSVGAAATLTDTGTSAQSMTAGGSGLTINAVGPFP